MKRKASIGKPLTAAKPPPKCIACNGSGHYDVGGSPKCGECNGTGLASEQPLSLTLDRVRLLV